jgi:hypothetical protein
VFFYSIYPATVKKGQYDDDYTPSPKCFFDDELIKQKPKQIKTTPENKYVDATILLRQQGVKSSHFMLLSVQVVGMLVGLLLAIMFLF